MSRTFVQPGNTIDAIAPAGGVKSNDGIVLGSLFGIAEVDAAEGETYSLTLVGVHRVPKATGGPLAAGALAYWDAAAKNVTATAAGNTMIGAIVEQAASADTSALVRLNGGTTTQGA
jgi:predicted RecA/RadA family phage recombinase